MRRTLLGICALTAFVATTALPFSAPARGTELLGYLENWVDVKWWDNNMPGNCYMGCFEPAPFLELTKPYTALNYGFAFLTQNPDPDQLDCSGSHGGNKDAGCPVWDGEAIYLAKASKAFSKAVDSTTTVDKPTPSIIAIADAVRLARMHPEGPKRLKITLGGWSDFTSMSTPENGEKVAVLAAKLVQYSFADGLDIDMEHLTPFANSTSDDEFGAFAAFVKKLRSEFNNVEATWAQTAQARASAMQKEYDGMQNWQKTNAKNYYTSTINYLKEVAANPAPHLEISWCTRFNAFVPKDDPFNYHMPGTPVPNTTYPTDNEGTKLWPQVGDDIDTVNIMAYDAGVLSFNFSTILENFRDIGNVPPSKINMGFEPGQQYAGGHWEGMERDQAAAKWVKENGFGGVMIWAVNPSAKQNPAGAVQCPKVAESMAEIIEPTFAWGPAPKYTKCDANGWWPAGGPTPPPAPPTPTPPTPTPPTPPSPTPPSPGSCAAAWQQCGAAGHPSCCEGSCTCTGSGTYKQCSPPTGQWQCGTKQ